MSPETGKQAASNKVVTAICGVTSSAKVAEPRCEFVKNPLGIGETRPRLSWRMEDARRSACQTAWQIIAASDAQQLDGKPDLWDSGKVAGSDSLDIIYDGKKLKSRSRVAWRVRIWDADGEVTAWSEVATFEVGLLNAKDWEAKWIGRDSPRTEEGLRSPYLRRAFDISGEIVSARLYVTALGGFEMRINGKRVGEDYFTPGWTAYDKRVQSLTYDVTEMLHPGSNAIGAMLGVLWYAGMLTWVNKPPKNHQTALMARLEIICADGSKNVVITDEDWRTADSPVMVSEIYHGERYDAREEIDGWCEADFDDSQWDKPLICAPVSALIEPARTLPVRKMNELGAIDQTEPVAGAHVFDMGQNMVGLIRIKVNEARGRTIKLRFAEMLNEDGTLYTANYRSAKSTDYYTCRGEGDEIWEPRFTFHGFRYVELSGLSAKPDKSAVTGVVLHSDMEKTGEFECSNPLVNRLQRNIEWGQRGNYLEIPTDCPQRDERLGWTGDAQVFIRTGAFNFNIAGFFTKWCVDLDDAQSPEGAYPFVAPNVLEKTSVGASAWSDAGIVCPWTEYLCYGDKRILEQHYDAMAKWIAYQEKEARGYILNCAKFGDWLALDVWSLNPRFDLQLTNRELISTACFARTTALMGKIANVLGKHDDARKFARLLKKIKTAFNKEFVTSSGRLVSETQTAYLLALANDLLPLKLRKAAFANLTALIEKADNHLSTGFVGTPLIAPVLTDNGRSDLAYKVFLQQTYPGWLYSVLQGATTMWERWNSYSKEAGFGDDRMNSFNHYAYGAIGEWMYARVAGIDLDESLPAYKHIVIHPQFPPKPADDVGAEQGITWVTASLKTRYGFVKTHWEFNKKGKIDLTATIPPNTTATIMLPGRKPVKVEAGVHVYKNVRPHDR